MLIAVIQSLLVVLLAFFVAARSWSRTLALNVSFREDGTYCNIRWQMQIRHAWYSFGYYLFIDK